MPYGIDFHEGEFLKNELIRAFSLKCETQG